jgi:AcrR family transcriptional regulator
LHHRSIRRRVRDASAIPRRANIRPEEPGRDRVLAAALDLFATKGFDATSIAEIGERAGIGRSVLYHHFGSKAGLFEALAAEENRRIVTRVRTAADAGAQRRLRPGIDAYLEALAERPAAARLLLRQPPGDPELNAVHERLSAERERELARILSGPEKRLAQRAHVELVAAAVRTFASWWLDNLDVPREQVLEAILDVARAGARRLR